MSGQGQPDNTEIVDLLSIGPFGGLDATTSPYYVSPSNFPDMVNFTPNDVYGGYTTALGRVAKGSLPNQPNGIYKFMRKGLPDTYLFACDVAGAGALYAGPLGGPYTSLALPTPLTPGQTTYFESSLQWVFITNGVDNPIKVDQNLVVTNWGIVEPQSAPVLMAAGTSTMRGVYYYAITFASATQESSQGVISAPITVNNTGVGLTMIPKSTDPQVTQRNIYRIGGALGTWQLVGTLNDNTTTTYADTLPDSQVTGQILVLRRDSPPPFKFIKTHQERIWGFGTPTDASIVYFSNINEPWGFNVSTGNRPVGENSFNDDAAGIETNGSILVLCKRKSLYYVYGESDDNFQVTRASTTGCTSGKSVATLDGMTCWVNRRGVWSTTGQAPEIISDGKYQASNIKNILRKMKLTDLQQAVGFWYDRMYHISFPTLNRTYFFDLRSDAWYSLGWACRVVYSDPESDQPVVTDNQQLPGQVVQWFASPTDLGQPIQSSITSRVSDSGDSKTEKVYTKAEVLAPPQQGICYVTVTANPGNQQTLDPRQVNLSNGTTRHQISLPRNLRGTEVQVMLQTLSSIQLTIQKVTVYGQVDRQLIEQSNSGASQ